MVWPLRPMMRPTSLWRSCSLKIVILPLGISEIITSSGNSTSWRMTNSRNSFMSILARRGRMRGPLLHLHPWCGRRLFFVFLNQTAHRVGWLGAPRDPIFGAIKLKRAVMTGLLRIVRPDDLDEFSIARAAAVGHDHLVIRAVQRAFSS